MQRKFQRVLNVLVVVAMVLAMGGCANVATPRDEALIASSAPSGMGEQDEVVAKLPPVAIGAIELQSLHRRAPREETALSILTQEGVISRGSTQVEIQAALDNYYHKFYARGADWVDPEIEKFALQREAELANPSATSLAITPVTATVFALAVQFGATEALTVGTCITRSVVITGPMQGDLPHPSALDNETLWFSPTQTADPNFYRNLVFGYQGIGRARYDLTDPDDGQPGINLNGYTVQDFYDHVAGPGNVVITGTFDGWVTVPHSEGYYGANDCTTNNDGGIVPVGQLAVDALEVYSTTNPGRYNDVSADAFWPKYDQNKDGLVDAFWIVHAGVDESSGGGQEGEFAIWAHSWSLAAQGLSFKVYEGSPVTTTDDIYVSPYTMQPESLDLGVVAEEFGHNFFGWPDLYTNDAENSVGNWVGPMSSGSWLGWLGGTTPPSVPLWFRMIASYRGPGGTRVPLNWQEPMITRQYTDTAAAVTIGQLEKTPNGVAKGVRINLPGIPEYVGNNAGAGKGAFVPSANNADYWLTRSLAVGATATGTLSVDIYWDTEPDYDYAQVTINGTPISDTTAYMTDGPYGWGLTGNSAVSRTLSFNLSAFKGATVTLGLRLVCDEGTNNPGYWADNVKLDGALVDNFEGATATAPDTFPGWTNDGNWLVVPYNKLHDSYYLVEWRTKTKYDQMVKTAYVTTDYTADTWRVERTPYNIPAVLVYYRNAKYGQSYSQRPWYNDSPSYGPKNKLLLVDMNYQPMRIVPTSTNILDSRAASYDAGLTLQPTERFTITKLSGITSPAGPYVFPSKPAIDQFNDAKGYYAGFYYNNGYFYSNRDGSTVIPARDPYSTRITHFDLTPFPEMYEAPILDPYVWWGGTGNPGDDNVQYGVNLKLASITGENTPYSSTATLSISNYSVDIVSSAPDTIRTTTGAYTSTYQTVVHNVGTEASNPVTVTYATDPALTVVSLTANPGVGTVNLATPEWSIASLTAGQTVTLTLVTTGQTNQSGYIETDVEAWDGQMQRGPWFLFTDIFTYRLSLPLIRR